MTMSRNRSLLLVVLASAIALFLGLSVAGSSNAVPSVPDAAAAQLSIAQGTSIEAYHFDSLEAMAATSSLVVRGTVTQVSAGRSHGAAHDEMGWSNAVVSIDEVLAGSVGQTVTVEQLITQAGAPVLLNGLPPLKPGDAGFFFLRRGEDDTYALINSQGRYLERSGQLHARTGDGHWVSRAEQLSPRALRAAVTRAREALAQGRVHAQRPAFGAGAQRPT